MKPVRFEYDAPGSVDDAIALLKEHGDGAKVLAGGQSLAPMLNFRLARPTRIIDINRLVDLAHIREQDDLLAIGAITRQRQIELSDVVARRAPLLRTATRWIAHPAVRVRGTIGGSLAHNDPAAEYPAVLLALDARVRVQGPTGDRTMAVDELLGEWLSTTLGADELIVGVDIPLPGGRTGHGFAEVSKRHGDYALAGVVVLLVFAAGGEITSSRVVSFGGLPRAVRLQQAEDLLRGNVPSDKLFVEVAQAAAGAIEPVSDIHASAEYRKQLVNVLTVRALRQAIGREA